MPFYTFHMFTGSGVAVSLDAKAFPDDGAAFDYAERLLGRHPSCDRIDIWSGDRSVAARYRQQPILGPVEGPRQIAADLIGSRADPQSLGRST